MASEERWTLTFCGDAEQPFICTCDPIAHGDHIDYACLRERKVEVVPASALTQQQAKLAEVVEEIEKWRNAPEADYATRSELGTVLDLLRSISPTPDEGEAG